jgi:hypothetical protein
MHAVVRVCRPSTVLQRASALGSGMPRRPCSPHRCRGPRMHGNDAFDSIIAPIRGARRGLLVRTVFGHVTTFPAKDGDPATCASALGSIHRGRYLGPSSTDLAIPTAPQLPSNGSMPDTCVAQSQPAYPKRISRRHKPMVHHQGLSTKVQTRTLGRLGCRRQRQLIPRTHFTEASR